MKVCTDACVFGAWIADRMKPFRVADILDIGCGTGLLGLMLVQQLHATVDAIEIDPAAAEQANENALLSPWPENIHVILADIMRFVPGKKYDLIISNPPFYEDDLRSGNKQKDAAKHDTALRLEELVSFVNKHITAEGKFAVLLPFHRSSYFERTANEAGFFVQEKLLMKQSPGHDHFRAVLLLSKIKTEPMVHELTIHDKERNYTKQFVSLLKDYYLKL